jgi:hypothetical protein
MSEVMRSVALLLVMLSASTALSQMPVDETAAMRAASLEKRLPRELPGVLAQPPSYSWQQPTPEAWRGSLKIPLAAEPKLDPRLANADRGYVERHRPALEQLALGLSADPPRPEYPTFASGPRAAGSALSTFELLQLPPLSRTSDAPLTLSGDPASIAVRPFTAPLAAATRGPAPPRSDIAIPDPYAIRREMTLPPMRPDADPPALSFGVPERPMFELAEKKP